MILIHSYLSFLSQEVYHFHLIILSHKYCFVIQSRLVLQFTLLWELTIISKHQNLSVCANLCDHNLPFQVLQLNISSQQSTIDSLNEKALTLKRTSRDGNLGAQITQVVSRYEKLVKNAKVNPCYCFLQYQQK